MTIGDVVAQVLAELPPEDRAAVANVRLICKPSPEAKDYERGCVAGQMASFWGVGRQLGETGYQELPDDAPAEGVITLYLANLAPLTAERIRLAYSHELGHALGWSEDELQAMGLWVEPSQGGVRACSQQR